MTKKITIPFNWDTYQSDKSKYTVVTREKEIVSELTKFQNIDKRFCKAPIYGVVEGNVTGGWNEYGKSYILDQSYDLFLQYEEEVEELVESWVNVYKNNGQGPSYGLGTVYTTREECINHKDEGYLYTINLNDIVNYFNNYFL